MKRGLPSREKTCIEISPVWSIASNISSGVWTANIFIGLSGNRAAPNAGKSCVVIKQGITGEKSNEKRQQITQHIRIQIMGDIRIDNGGKDM